MRKEILLIFSIILLLLTTNFVYAADISDPSTWSAQEIKEWLNERNIPYSGIPEKRDLIELVRVHFSEKKEQAKNAYDVIEKFIINHVELLTNNTELFNNNNMNETPDSILQKLADRYENVRVYASLSEDQIKYAFNQISEKLKDRKNSIELLEQIKQSYLSVISLIQKTNERIQKDLENNDQVSQETIDWFKEKINNLRESEANLVLQGVQEQFAQRKIAVSSADQAQMIFEKLGSTVKESYRSVNGTLERLRKELAEVIGGKAENVIEDLRSQFSTVNDYRILTQEKIQGALDQIGQKLQDGKAVTVEQLQHVKDILKRYTKYYYDSATGKAIQTKKEQEERLNEIIASIKEGIQENRERGEEQLSKITETVKEKVAKSQHLTERQAEVLSDIIKEQFGSLKDTRDLTEEKMLSLFDNLKIKLRDTKEYLAQETEAAYNKASEGYDKVSEGFDTMKDKVNEGYDTMKDRVNEGYDTMKEKVTSTHRDEL
ncbi:hypothetical protein Glove_156g52 [Diversispora epigaea]|uniref:SAP domain-containing protein n=1 Tax=Diversispora epigaea TaxID=1348612 RepID=A0A397IRZ2_9GLOM|nr:hypothetical protein Glove_156g52 [Diversispora epigaea]